MCDISDVTALMAQMALAAVYPSGFPGLSITGRPITVAEGWPIQQNLDAEIAAGNSYVSIFPNRGSGAGGAVFQIQNNDYLVKPPVHGMRISSIEAGAVKVMGVPTPGEYLTVIVEGRRAYSRFGSDLPTILNQLAADAIGDYPSVSVFSLSGPHLPFIGGHAVGGAIQFPTDLVKAHIGSPATKGRVTHRQRPTIMVSVWSPNNDDRNLIGRTVDEAFKAVNRLTFPDQSEGLMKAEGFYQDDKVEPASVFRRDLIFSVEYATLELFTAYEITSFSLSINDGAEATYVEG